MRDMNGGHRDVGEVRRLNRAGHSEFPRVGCAHKENFNAAVEGCRLGDA